MQWCFLKPWWGFYARISSFFLKFSHMLVDLSFEAWILKNLQTKKNAVFIFSDFILFCSVYPSFMTSSSCDLSLFGLLVMGYTFLTKIGSSCVESQGFLFSPAAFHSVWGLWFMDPIRLFKNHCWKWARAAQPLYWYDMFFPKNFPHQESTRITKWLGQPHGADASFL